MRGEVVTVVIFLRGPNTDLPNESQGIKKTRETSNELADGSDSKSAYTFLPVSRAYSLGH